MSVPLVVAPHSPGVHSAYRVFRVNTILVWFAATCRAVSPQGQELPRPNLTSKGNSTGFYRHHGSRSQRLKTIAGAAGLEPSGQDLCNRLNRWHLARSRVTLKSQKTHIFARLMQKLVGKW